MNVTLLVALVFAVLLVLEWRYRLRSVRLGTALFALVVLSFAHPLTRRAARKALLAPPEERVTQLRGSPVPEYVSGVLTMEEFFADEAEMESDARLLAIGVLFWLACSPALRRAGGPSGGAGRSRPEIQESRGGTAG